MLAIKINDPHMEKYLSDMACKEGKSRQAIAREMIMKQIEDSEDYQAAVEAMADIKSGRSKVISSQELWRELGLDN